MCSIPYPTVSEDDIFDPEYCIDNRNVLLHRAKYRSLLYEKFVERWNTEYLISLRERHASKGSPTISVKVGDVVLIHHESDRLTWNLGIVKDLIHGKDGLVRSVTLRTKSGITNRPIVKLYPSEVSSTEFDHVSDDSVSINNSPDQSTRPTRVAKDIAKQNIKSYFQFFVSLGRYLHSYFLRV